jgi:hypothetical protein
MKKMILVAAIAAFMAVAGVAAADGLFTGGAGGAGAKPGMVLPDTIYVATTRQLNIYAEHLSTLVPPALSSNTATTATAIAGGFPWVYDFQSRIGVLRNRGYRWTPASADSTSSLAITAYDYSGKAVESVSTIIKPITITSGIGRQKVLFVGDSFFDASGTTIIAEVDSLFSTQGGGNIVPIGTQSTDGYNHESHAGKDWNFFVTNPSGPFWDTGRLNFKSYLTRNSIYGPIEMVVVNLGGNTAFGFATGTKDRAMSAADVDTAVVQLAKAFVDTLQNATYGFPNAHIVFNIMPAPSALMSAYGNNYGGADNGAYVNYQKSMRAIAKAMIREFDGGAYDRHVDICYGGLWMDPVLAYPNDTSNASSVRTASINEIQGTNFLHPYLWGSHQVADAIFSHLKYTYTLSDCGNNLVDSYRFTNNTYWYKSAAPVYWTLAASQADPWGGTSATSFTGTADVIAGAYMLSTTSTLNLVTADHVVISAFVKNGNLATNDRTNLRLYSTDIGTTTDIGINWTTTPTITAAAGVGASGLIALGDGWYQIWMYKDLSQIVNTAQVSIRFDPCSTTPAENNVMYCAGFQLEYGVTTPCGTYVQKP